MKTSLTLAFTAMMSCGVLAQSATNLPAPPPAAPELAPKQTEAPAPKKKAAPKKKTAAPAAKKLAKPAEVAVPLAPGPATVTTSNVNVRGQARLTSERIARLNAGDTVTVLEEIVLDKPAADEPARWARIALPAEVKVWVNTTFIDATNKTVIPRRLNLRSGPGENFSVVGLVEQGQHVQEVGAVQGDWMQIEAPTNAYSFVASQYLKQAAPVAALAATTPPPASPRQVAPVPVPTPVTMPSPVRTAPAPAPTPSPVLSETAPPIARGPASPAAIERAREATRQKLAELAAQETPPPRIVSHEGIVRSTWSIQAPTKFALMDRATGKTINYLYTTSTNLDLKKYKGLRTIITGEEGLDERWKNTPVLTIQKIQVVE